MVRVPKIRIRSKRSMLQIAPNPAADKALWEVTVASLLCAAAAMAATVYATLMNAMMYQVYATPFLRSWQHGMVFGDE